MSVHLSFLAWVMLGIGCSAWTCRFRDLGPRVAADGRPPAWSPSAPVGVRHRRVVRGRYRPRPARESGCVLAPPGFEPARGWDSDASSLLVVSDLPERGERALPGVWQSA